MTLKEEKISTYRLLPGVVEHARIDIMGLALDLVGPAAVVPYGTYDGTEVTSGHVDGLAVVKGLDSGQKICVLLE